MQALFIIRTLHHIICLPLFNIYNWFISQTPDFSTDLQQTVCYCNWFISQNPDIFLHFAKSRHFSSFRKIQTFFFISQNPDFINVVKNVDFAKSRFFLFRKLHVSQFRKIHISQNPVGFSTQVDQQEHRFYNVLSGPGFPVLQF